MKRRPSIMCAFALALMCAQACSAADGDALSSIRYRMLVDGQIDGYPNDDDVTAIGRYLTSAGDNNLDVPQNISSWIVSRIGGLGPSATPRLISGYMHFLRAGASAPPFSAGTTTSTRYALLVAIADELAARKTPLANLALLMFSEIDDASIKQIAQLADYGPIKSFPWLTGKSDWMQWIFVGLNPDLLGDQSSPDYPLDTPQAKAGLLTSVRDFISSLDIRPPTIASSLLFRDRVISPMLGLPRPVLGWANIGPAPVRELDPKVLLTQCERLASVTTGRIAGMFGIPPPMKDPKFIGGIPFLMSMGACPVGVGTMPDWLRSRVGLPPLPSTEIFRDTFQNLYEVLDLQQWRLIALGSYALVAHQHSYHDRAVDIGPDAVFARLRTIHLPTAKRRTRFAPSISPAQLRAAAGPNLSALSACSPRSASVSARLISLHNRTYIETIRMVCTHGIVHTFTRAGILPTDFARMLEINPDFLDIVGTSLAMRELSSLSPLRMENPQDLDLIRNNPKVSAGLLLAVLAHPTTPWAYVRDALLQYWPASIEWAIPGWRPALLSLLKPSVAVKWDIQPAVVSELAPADYVAHQKDLFQSLQARLEIEAQIRFINGVIPAINAMPSFTTNCGNFIMQFLSFGGSCGASEQTSKGSLVNQINVMKAQVDAKLNVKKGLACIIHEQILDSCGCGTRWPNTVTAV